MSGIEIRAPQTADEVDALRQLCWDYRTFLLNLSPFDAEIIQLFYPEDKYAALMAQVETEHALPDGFLRLAFKDGSAVGCAMVHTLAPGTAEIKRVFVSDPARGTGAGRALMQDLVAECRAMGFQRILMDTSKPLKAAQSLYLSLGFSARGPYQPIPEMAKDHLLFFEMELT
jgi:GNAT superfamily N-acetyltransferase